MAEKVVWHVHRDDFRADKDTVRGVITGVGAHTDDAKVQTFQTLERISTIIPAGEYLCTLDYWHGGDMPAYEIQWPWDEDGDGRPDRDRLLIHPANAIRNKGGEYILLGCIALGSGRAENFWDHTDGVHPLAKGLPGITASREAVRRFMDANRGVEQFTLVITEHSGGE